MGKAPARNDGSSAQEEIRFVKDQQWRPVYYPLVLFSSIVVIFSQRIIDKTNSYYPQLRALAIILIALVGIVSIFWQWSNFKALQDYRRHPAIGQKPSKTVTSVIITATFSITTVSGTAFVLLYLLT